MANERFVQKKLKNNQRKISIERLAIGEADDVDRRRTMKFFRHTRVRRCRSRKDYLKVKLILPSVSADKHEKRCKEAQNHIEKYKFNVTGKHSKSKLFFGADNEKRVFPFHFSFCILCNVVKR